MPQLSLYIDEETLRKIETAARINKTSVSKYVSQALKEHLSRKWPEGYKEIFGSITDDSFSKSDSLNFAHDLKRESL